MQFDRGTRTLPRDFTGGTPVPTFESRRSAGQDKIRAVFGDQCPTISIAITVRSSLIGKPEEKLCTSSSNLPTGFGQSISVEQQPITLADPYVAGRITLLAKHPYRETI